MAHSQATPSTPNLPSGQTLKRYSAYQEAGGRSVLTGRPLPALWYTCSRCGLTSDPACSGVPGTRCPRNGRVHYDVTVWQYDGLGSQWATKGAAERTRAYKARDKYDPRWRTEYTALLAALVTQIPR